MSAVRRIAIFLVAAVCFSAGRTRGFAPPAAAAPLSRGASPVGEEGARPPPLPAGSPPLGRRSRRRGGGGGVVGASFGSALRLSGREPEGGGGSKRGGWLTSGDKYGNDRAVVLFAIVAALNVWIFTLPPDFRRANICAGDYCERHPDRVCDCVTFQTWTGDIAEYYRGGGGVQFDFSVDPRTVQANQEKWDAIFGSK